MGVRNCDAGVFRFKTLDQSIDRIDAALEEVLPVLDLDGLSLHNGLRRFVWLLSRPDKDPDGCGHHGNRQQC